MIKAMEEAAKNLNSVLTMDQFKVNLMAAGNPDSLLKQADRTLALTDIVNGLNHLNQFIGCDKLPEDRLQKESILKSLETLKNGQAGFVTKLDAVVKNKVAVSMNGKPINLGEVVPKILVDITTAAIRLI